MQQATQVATPEERSASTPIDFPIAPAGPAPRAAGGDLPLIGEPLDRADGRAKVAGTAKYTGDFLPPNLAYAVLVQSTISKGRVTAVDTAAAQASPGVVAILSYSNGPKPQPVPPTDPRSGSSQSPGVELMLKDPQINFFGQDVAVVVAETLEQAQRAAKLVKITYATEEPVLGLAENVDKAQPPSSNRDKSRGDAAAAHESAATKIDRTYTTPIENHNPMEMHATVAVWDESGAKLTVYDTTQFITGVKQTISHALKMLPEDIRVISYYLGGGFGSKGTSWPHISLCAATAREVRRPVKLMLSRPQMFTSVGRRSPTVQRLRLGASTDGKLTAISHDTLSQSATYAEFVEMATQPTGMLYACPNVRTTQKVVKTNEIVPTYMRAPGESTGVFAIETALDELAYELKIDPLQLRLINHADTDPENGHPWSSKSLKQCYQQAADRFGWSKRSPEPRSMRDGNTLVGYGMATATYPTNRRPASAKVHVYADGTVGVESGTQDLGTGTYTVMAQVTSESLGVPIARVRSRLGDTLFPPAGVSGGSSTCASVGSAVRQACEDVKKKLIALATSDDRSPLRGLSGDAVTLADGKLVSAAEPSRAESFADLLARNGQKEIVGEMRDSKSGDEAKQYGMHSFGAVFVEVRVDPDLCEIRVPRVVAAYAGGRIINAKTARSQFLGGLVWGISMALHEQTVTDLRSGQIVNANFADYLVPVNADIRDIDVVMVEEEDPHVNPIGVKGIGEIGIVGVAGAVSNAIYHATGKRVRDLPITIEKLL